jgi:nucleotide-binding universal stress UspA family protein
MVDAGTSSSLRGWRPQRPVVVGCNGRKHSRGALRWAAGEAVRRRVRLVVLYAANYPGMTLGLGPGLLELEPGALDAAREVTFRGVAEALEAHPDLRVVGVTEVTSPSQALTEASLHAELVVIGTRGFGRRIRSSGGRGPLRGGPRGHCVGSPGDRYLYR